MHGTPQVIVGTDRGEVALVHAPTGGSLASEQLGDEISAIVVPASLQGAREVVVCGTTRGEVLVMDVVGGGLGHTTEVACIICVYL